VIDNCLELGATKFNLSGGEILLVAMSKLKQILEYIQSCGAVGVINTNGRLVTDKLLGEIGHATKQINFGFNSTNPKTNMLMGKYQPNEKYGNYEELILANMDKVNNHNLLLELNILMSALNIPDMEDMAQVINDKKIKRVRANEFTPSRGAKANNELFATTREEYLAGCQKLKTFCPSVEVALKTKEYYENGFSIVTSNGMLIVSKNGVDIPLADLRQDKIDGKAIVEKVGVA